MVEHAVLVVDDEPASLRAVRRALADSCEVITAAGGAEGLAVLMRRPVSLMIVDQRMPDMTGTELLARSAAQYPEVIRVLLTGYGDVDTLIESINAGHVYHYLSKPWEPQELRLVVRRGLERYVVEAERRRLLRELQAACQLAQREADQKGRLLAVAAHELGTPLHILANALALLEEAELPSTVAPWLDTARRSVVWLSRCVEQMTQAVRVRPGQLRLRRRWLDPRTLVEELCNASAEVIARRNLQLLVDLPIAVPRLQADPLWLRRALSNLLSNAVRFTPDGGCITVAVIPGSAAVDIVVSDTGVGIDAAVLEEIFEPFSAAGGELAQHSSGQSEFGSRGLGLGLAIARAIVEQHGGTIGVDSRQGSGSRFTVSLPVDGRLAESDTDPIGQQRQIG